MYTDTAQLKAFEQERADSCELDLTGICNAGCTYCYAQSTPQTIEEISTETIYQVLDDLNLLLQCHQLYET